MLCLEGTGALSHVSLRNKPDVFNEPCVFAAVGVKGEPDRGPRARGAGAALEALRPPETGNGAGGKSYGLPRFASARFLARFPFATVTLADAKLPLEVEITAWSPFEPGDADGSSLPVAALEYRFRNRRKRGVEAVFSLNAMNFMAAEGRPRRRCAPTAGGFVLWGGGHEGQAVGGGRFLRFGRGPRGQGQAAWFRGGWFDPLTLAWKDVEPRPPASTGRRSPRARRRPGASLFVPVRAGARANRDDDRGAPVVVRRRQRPALRQGPGRTPSLADPPERFRPWYAGSVRGRRRGGRALARALRRAARQGRALPRLLLRHDPAAGGGRGRGRQPDHPEVAHRAAAGRRPPLGLGRLRRQRRLLQRLVHARLELRPGPARISSPTSSGPCARPSSAPRRTRPATRPSAAALPIRPIEHDFHAAADGQLGGIMKVHREWRISGDTEWLRRLWPSVQAEPRLLHRDLGPAATKASSKSPTTTPTTSSSGARTGCARASTSARSRAAVLMGKAARRRRAALRGASRARAGAGSRPTSSTASTSSRRSVEGPAGREPPRREEHGGRVLARGAGAAREGGAQVPVRRRLPLRRRARRVDGRGVRRRPGPRRARRSRATCAPCTATTSRRTSPSTRTRSGRPSPAARRAGCCSAPGPRAAALACRSSTRTRCGRGSSTRWRRT